MRFDKIFTSLIFLFLAIQGVDGQKLDHVQGEILIQFREDARPQEWNLKHASLRSTNSALKVEHCISENFKVWSLQFDWRTVNELDLLQALRRDPAIVNAQFNHFVELRSATPNDPFYGDQWFLNNTAQRSGFVAGVDLEMEEAWDITTGGVTPEGDTIVICVIDNGLDPTHEDFQGNLWVNRNEIAGNGIDDDGNGYVDDVRGWHVLRGNDNTDDANWHGTLTAGIIGAKGNNGIGVTGINWDVQLMIVVGGFGQAVESRIIEAYDYCLTQRRLYNETDGEKGAFVVASNSSWGLGESTPKEFPLWCAVYDSLGVAGIINVAATANEKVDVDAVGDMPTTCTSDFLISVTNVGGDGTKIEASGFGATSIDLGAFGDQIFSTGDGNNYREDGGTSFATPMVTGAVGLLYAANCPNLSAIYKQSPQDAALMVKDLILRGVEPEASLAGITVTGGRLNIHNSLQLLLNECGDCPPLLQVGTENLLDTSTDIKWLDNELINRVDFRWRQEGDSDWQEMLNVSSPLSFDNLLACTNYEYQFRIFCEVDTLDYEASSYTFKTDGCCDAPDNVRINFVGNSSAVLSWDDVLAARNYTMRYREIGSEDNWIERFASNNGGNLFQLTSCVEYEVQVRTNCTGENSEFGESVIFTTLGCGACLDLNYCTPDMLEASQSDSEWIANVTLNDLDNSSSGQGYSDFTGLESVQVSPGDTVRLKLTPGFSGFPFDEFFKVWIDFDQDGFFSSADVLFESTEPSGESIDTMLIIPQTVELGKTRMRVVMKFNAEPSSCTTNNSDFFGEVEDYCITIDNIVSSTNNNNALAQIAQLKLYPNPAQQSTTLELRLKETMNDGAVELINTKGQVVWNRQMNRIQEGNSFISIPINELTNGIYFVRFRSEMGYIYEKLIVNNL